jgi:8-oxo-dGTP pyrophosphatase MutT (NUDIX family)
MYKWQKQLFLHARRIKIGAVETQLKQYLSRKPKHAIFEAGRISSAVLIPIFKKDGHYHILFIKRTMTVKTHRGQISFPGGVREKEDKTLLDTALREVEEEIGLHTKDVAVLGELDDVVTTTSNFIVSPFVGLIPYPYTFIPEKAEVDMILTIPITGLLEEGCLQPDTEILNGQKVVSFAYNYRGQIIWGATARILHMLLEIITRMKMPY